MSSALRSEAISAIAAAICSGVVMGSISGLIASPGGTARGVRCTWPPGRAPGTGSAGRRGPGGGSWSRRRRSGASGRTRPARRRAVGPARPATEAREVPRRLAMARVASLRTCSGCRHSGRPTAMSPPTIRKSSLSDAWSCSSFRVSTVYDGPSRVSSMSETSKRSSPVTAWRHISRRWRGPGSCSTGLWGGMRAGISITRSRRSSPYASCAHTRWPRCGGLKVPPRIPRRTALRDAHAGCARRPRPGT